MFLAKARDYGRSIGFKGTYFIEPKPMEPTKHQYDFDAATVIGFLRNHGLEKDFKINVENNHATLAGHTFAHEVQVAADAGLLGSLDVNQGDPHNGWDTDEFLHDLYEAVKLMLVERRAQVVPQPGERGNEFRCQNAQELHRPGGYFCQPYQLHGYPGARIDHRRSDFN